MTEHWVRFKLFFYICALLIGFAVSGFCLAALHASSWIWILSGLVILYLAKVGLAGIFLANVWVTFLLVMLIVIRQPWPDTSPAGVPLNVAQIWSGSLLLIWFLAEVLIFLMAFASHFLNEQQWDDRWRIGVLASIAWLSMGLGSVLFHWKILS